MSGHTAAARPKRGGNQTDAESSSSSKKPRFDHRHPSILAADARDPDEDPILDMDVIGKSGVQVKRNAVNIDGYDSDSDNDNFDTRAAQRKHDEHEAVGSESHSVAEEEDDMFADLEDKEDGEHSSAGRGKSKKKDVRFLEQGEAEGQVMSSKSGGKVSSELLIGYNGKGKTPQEDSSDDTDSSDDDDDARRASLPQEMDEEDSAEIGAGGKKRHAPRLDAFNLKQEEEEGRFDESGNYVRKAKDPNSVNDTWLKSSRQGIKDTKKAHDRRAEAQRKKQLEEDAILTKDLLSALIQHLKSGETPMEALRRLNKSRVRKPKIPQWKLKKMQQQKKKNMDNMDNMDVDKTSTNVDSQALDAAEAKCREALEAIADSAARLLSRGHDNVYEDQREGLMRQYRRETGEDWQDPKGDVAGEQEWEFQWVGARCDGHIHGPFSAPTMKAWNDTGCFVEDVEFRAVGDKEWSRTLDLG